MRFKVFVRLLAVALPLVLAAGACTEGTATRDVATLGDSEPAGGEETSTVGAEEAALLFAQCMRDNGIDDFVDPTVGDKDVGGQVEHDKMALDEAYEICAEHLRGSTKGKSNKDDTAGDDRLYELAVCMRANGFDMPDPDPTGDAYVDLDKEHPDFEATFQLCEDVFTDGAEEEAGK